MYAKVCLSIMYDPSLPLGLERLEGAITQNQK